MQQNKVSEHAGTRSVYKYAKISPKKVMPVLNMVRGKKVGDAVNFLTFDPTKAAKLILKTLNSAVANARQKDTSNPVLYVAKATADTAPTAKRGRPGSRSHYNKILKRSSHITVVVGSKEGK